MTVPAGVICLGEALIDLIPPTNESLVTATALHAMPGGAPLNIAIHLKRSGHAPLFAGSLSSDGFGDRIRNLLGNEDIPYLPRGTVDAPTRLAIIDRREGYPPFRFYGDDPADSRLSVNDLDAIFQPQMQAIYAGSLMMIHQRSRSTQIEALQRAATGNLLIACDPNPRPAAWQTADAMNAAVELLLEFATLAKLSIDDARALGWPDEPEALLARVRNVSPATLVITDGPRGCWISDSVGELEHYTVTETPIVDATGAGDTFFAAIIAGMLSDGFVSRETALHACREGARIAGQQGAF